MKFYDQLAELAANTWSDSQRHSNGETDLSAVIGKAANSAFDEIAYNVDMGRYAYSDDAECVRVAALIIETYGITLNQLTACFSATA